MLRLIVQLQDMNLIVKKEKCKQSYHDFVIWTLCEETGQCRYKDRSLGVGQITVWVRTGHCWC